MKEQLVVVPNQSCCVTIAQGPSLAACPQPTWIGARVGVDKLAKTPSRTFTMSALGGRSGPSDF